MHHVVAFVYFNVEQSLRANHLFGGFSHITLKHQNELFQSLKQINAKLWVIEDDKRQCEKEKDFTEAFIKLSRDVHFLNDDRAKIKLEINNHTGSKIKEIKEYTSY